MKNEIDILSGFLLGLAAGAATGMLFAPSSGRQTRRNIRKTANNLVEETRESINRGIDKTVSGIGDSFDIYSSKERSSMMDILGI